MSHFGVLSYKGTGHLNPMIALSRELVARGHRVTILQTADMEDRIRAQGLEFCSIGLAGARPSDHSGRAYRWRTLRDVVALCEGVERIVFDMEFFLRQAPAAIVGNGIDTLIMDEISLAGPTVAEMFRLPYFVVSTSVPHNFGWSGPRSIDSGTTLLGHLQQAFHQVTVLRMRGPVRRRLDKLRRTLGLGSIRQIQQTFPELAHITQLPKCLDLPRRTLPRNFHYAGPFVDETARPPVPFPWDHLDGRTMVYASLGTSLGGDVSTFHLISEACAELDLQLVISLGGRRDPDSLRELVGHAIVVKDSPQLEILKRADIVISHSGLNTVLETLLEGKPMIVIPKGLDQPAVAARLDHFGVALVLDAKALSVRKIREALLDLLNQPGYRNAATKMKGAIRASCGITHAANIIEDSLKRRRGIDGRALSQFTCDDTLVTTE